MQKIFGNAPQPLPPSPPPPPAPTIDDAASRAAAERAAGDAALRKRGRAASVLTGPEGAAAPTAKKTLIGS